VSHKQTRQQSEFYFSIIKTLFNLITFVFNENKQIFFLNNHPVTLSKNLEKPAILNVDYKKSMILKLKVNITHFSF